MSAARSDTSASSDGVNFLDFAEHHHLALVKVHPGAKNPVGDGWQNLASKSRADWEQWQRDGFNIGVHAGASRVVIFDLDQKHGGIEAVRARFDAWCAAQNMAPLPHHVSTPSGGQHVFMKVPEGIDAMALAPDLRGTIGKGVDVLTADRQSVGPGSFFLGTADKPAGHYTFNDVPLYNALPSIIEFCTRARTLEAVPVVKVGTYDKGGVAKLVDWLNERDEFEDYQDWVSCGMALRAEFGDGGLDLWARSHDSTVTPDVIATKWKSFATEAKPGAVTLATLMKRAHDQGWTGTLQSAGMFAGVAELAAAAGAPGMPTPQNAEEAAHAAAAALDALPDLFRTSGEFVGNFTPPDYLVDTILQRGFLYSVTAQTGVGKTTVAMRLAAHVATEKPFCGHDVQKGQVLYFAGENPTDITMRWIGLTREMGIDPKTVDVHFTYGPNKLLPEIIARITREVNRKSLTLAAIIIDTAAAHFTGQLENDNDQNGDYARQLRSLCTLPGAPCVVVLCHPTKGAQTVDQMVPRGGGAFLAEVDGNIGLVRNAAGVLVASAIGKFRGPEFVPLNFALKVVRDHPRLVDTKGRQIPTIIAEPISYDEVKRREATSEKDEIKVLRFIDRNPRASLEDIGTAVFGQRGKPKAQRIVGDLIAVKQVLYDKIAGIRTLAPTVQKSLNALDSAVSATVSGAANVMPFPVPTRPQI
jgi:hypothetical protein